MSIWVDKYMSTIIAILNQKGGSGKTTLATNLARRLVLDGTRCLLVDSDPQGSARDWNAANNGDCVPVIGLDRRTLDRDLGAVKGTHDWIVIDGAPQLAELAVAAAKVAQVVLIPVQPSPYDIWAASDLVEVIKARQQVAEGRPRTAFVISRAIVGTMLAADVNDVLAQYELPIFQGRTHQRVVYANSAVNGSTVVDDEPSGPAAREIRAILTELKEFTNG